MSECLHTVETYCFSQDEQHIALDVRQSRIFAISLLEREILAAPEGVPVERLHVLLGQRYRDTEISRALERLRKRNLLLPHPAPPEKLSA